MRILIAHAFYRIPGGEDRYVEQQVDLLRERHEVALFAGNNDELSGATSAATRMLSPRAMRSRAAQAISEFGPDIVHVHNIYPSLGASIHGAARKAGVPLVQTVHNHRLRCPNGYRFTEGQVCDRCVAGNYANAVLHECFPTKAQSVGYATALWIDRFLRHLERDVDLFVAPSEYMADKLRTWGMPSERIAMVRNFAEGATPSSTGAGTYGVFAGRLSSEKGVDVLLAALAQAGDPDFTILGDGPLRADLEALAGRLGLVNTSFRGRVDREDIDRIVGGARYFVMPSLSDENSPLAVFEAMVRGVPPIVSDRGGLPELVSDPSLVTIPGDADDLARAVGLIRTDEALHARAAASARDFAEKELLPQTHLERLEAAYATAASIHRAR